MAVPQNALSLCRKFGRKGNTVRIRRKKPKYVKGYCGTVITVPYMAKSGRPYGMEKAHLV